MAVDRRYSLSEAPTHALRRLAAAIFCQAFKDALNTTNAEKAEEARAFLETPTPLHEAMGISPDKVKTALERMKETGSLRWFNHI